ncbi:MAG TPA: Glu-tRNA(Gln) amidotransferase subunit GatE [Candidatus Nanoarchaeia archaeon]|nr:Glu-tRNA(Gln) amidotransferase subunit GatE [Candidatus Nanoarchaeia archaeon]
MNYNELGFKCGLECHQQLEGRKLFCHCPTLVNDDSKPDLVIKRKLRTTAGEMGKIDETAKFEMKRDRRFIYEACSTSSCLIELDEEPPLEVNKEALETALQVALLTNSKIVDEIQFMRKTVIDGSNVSGFQRTALIAVDGEIKTSKGIVKIPTICLEEESAKKITENENEVYYRLDRLGVPLIEIATDASLKDSEHAKEAAAIIGMILRSTGKARRGLGSIRQDVNISIKGHPRVELKGFQDLRSIPITVENEVKRQLENLKKKELKSEVRKVNPDFTSTFLRPMPGASRMYVETDTKTIKITKEITSKIKIPELLTEKAIKLEKKYKLNPDLAREVIEVPYFEEFASKFRIEPNYIAQVLVEIPKELKSRFNVESYNLKQTDFYFVLNALSEGKISKSAVLDILKELAQGKKVVLNNYKVVDDKQLENHIKEILKKNPGAPFNALMGEVMKQLKGKVDGKKASELIKKLLK